LGVRAAALSLRIEESMLRKGSGQVSERVLRARGRCRLSLESVGRSSVLREGAKEALKLPVRTSMVSKHKEMDIEGVDTASYSHCE